MHAIDALRQAAAALITTAPEPLIRQLLRQLLAADAAAPAGGVHRPGKAAAPVGNGRGHPRKRGRRAANKSASGWPTLRRRCATPWPNVASM
jgi:hypothetical protein